MITWYEVCNLKNEVISVLTAFVQTLFVASFWILQKKSNHKVSLKVRRKSMELTRATGD